MKRILFVDDEPKILDGLRRMLRPQRAAWDVAFALGSDEALKTLESSSFDAVVSDMRMPGMDGAALLKIVSEKHPQTLRILLSGYTELESSYRAVPFAHQFLLKPCDPETLISAIDAGTKLSETLRSEPIAKIAGSLGDLPSAPRIYAELRLALEDSDASVDPIVKIVEKDVAITAKLLQLVNSAFFGTTRKVVDTKTAVMYLGVKTLHDLVLSVEIGRAFPPNKRIEGFSIERFQEHSSLTASIAARISETSNTGGYILAAGLLHDAGKLVLADRMPEEFARAIGTVGRDRRPLFSVEEELFGVSHAEVGAYLLSLWGLPYPVVEAVAYHHHPERISAKGWNPAAAVYVANLLAHGHGAGGTAEAGLVHSEIDSAVIESAGGADRLRGWHEVAASLATETQEVLR
jgi:HD-like signal output (HDOD) protein/CheY-like chemotaxis protein